MNIAKNRNKSLLAAVIIGAVVSVILLGAVFVGRVFADSEVPPHGRLITLYDRGVEQSFVTDADNMRDALEGAGVALDPRDSVEPGLDEDLVADEYQVNIYRARPVIIEDGAIRQKIITAAQTAEQIVESAKLSLYSEDKTELKRSENVLADGAGLKLVITRSISFDLTLYGKKIAARTLTSTVGDMLREKGVLLANNDRVSVPLETAIEPGMKVRVWREGKQTISVDESVDFPIERIKDVNRDVSFREIKQAGVKGKRTVMYEVVIQDGKETSRKEISSVTIVEAKKQVEIVGAKPSFSGDFAAALEKLRACEAGGNYANKNNPLYRGAYQFSYSTWANYGGYYDPADAPPEVQDEAARRLYERRGWQPWPTCGANLPDTYR